MDEIDNETKELLLKLARSSIEDEFINKHSETNILKKKCSEFFPKKQGVFTTLKINNQLRGCIGYPEPVLPLCTAIINSAKSASFEDPRFPPLTKEELNKINIEISVLTIPKRLDNSRQELASRIKIGRDGLIIRKGYYSGLLLPQVATEYNFNKIEFLEQTCLKAGLNKDCWKEKETNIYSFSAIIFSEKDNK